MESARSSLLMVVTIADQLSLLRRELPGVPRNNFIAEPQGKNTAPCIGLAALEVIRRDAEAVMIVVPADHWVADIDAFRKTLKTAVELAGKTDYLITIGIKPDYPETGYGYVMKIVVLPNSVPYIVAGLRLAIGRAILGVVVGEFFGASKGLGFLIATAATNYKVDVVFAGVAIFMGLSLILTMAVKKIESNLSRWRPEEAKTF